MVSNSTQLEFQKTLVHKRVEEKEAPYGWSVVVQMVETGNQTYREASSMAILQWVRHQRWCSTMVVCNNTTTTYATKQNELDAVIDWQDRLNTGHLHQIVCARTNTHPILKVMKVIDQHPSPMICSPQLIFEMEVCGSVAIFHKLGDFILFLFFHTAQCSTRELWFWWTPNAIAQLNLALVTQILHLFFFTIMHAAQIQYMAHTLHHHACALTIPFSCAQISIHLRLVLII